MTAKTAKPPAPIRIRVPSQSLYNVCLLLLISVSLLLTISVWAQWLLFDVVVWNLEGESYAGRCYGLAASGAVNRLEMRVEESFIPSVKKGFLLRDLAHMEELDNLEERIRELEQKLGLYQSPISEKAQ